MGFPHQLSYMLLLAGPALPDGGTFATRSRPPLRVFESASSLRPSSSGLREKSPPTFVRTHARNWGWLGPSWGHEGLKPSVPAIGPHGTDASAKCCGRDERDAVGAHVL
jgi:hypothetical protein